VDGMGHFSDLDRVHMILYKAALLNAGVHVCVINVEKGRNIPEQVAALFAWNEGKEATFRSILMLGFGSGESSRELAFSNSSVFREAAVSWVQKGGNFIVQGERVARCGQWPAWFGKTWTDGEYYTMDHACFAETPSSLHWCKWYHQAAGAITGDINVKATMLQDVPCDEILFGTVEFSRSHGWAPQAAVALGKCDQGTVSFFGDVNHKGETVRIIAIVARGH
jgi:hypothetical protein